MMRLNFNLIQFLYIYASCRDARGNDEGKNA